MEKDYREVIKEIDKMKKQEDALLKTRDKNDNVCEAAKNVLYTKTKKKAKQKTLIDFANKWLDEN